MGDPRTDILTGINYLDTKTLQADTQDRLNQLFSSIPNIPNLPHVQVGKPGVVNPEVDINLTQEDKDTLVRQQDLRLFDQAKQKLATISDSSYYPQDMTKRYIDESWGFRPDRDNEDFYAKQQGVLSEAGKAIFAKLPSYTLAKLGQGVGFIAGLINPQNWFDDNYIAAAADNVIARNFNKLEDNLKNDWLTSYQEAADVNKGFFQRAFTDLNFWTEDGIDAAAFMASAYVPGFAISKLGLGMKLAGVLGAGRAAGSGSELLSSLGKWGLSEGSNKLLTTIVNTASESLFEARDVRDKIYNDMIAKGATDKEARDASGTKARNSFLSNIAALGFSNMWETNLFYKAMGKNKFSTFKRVEDELEATPLTEAYRIAEAAPSSSLGKFFNTKYGYYTKKALEGIGVEGFYEENIQLAIQRINDGSSNKNIASQYFAQTIDAIKGDDPEASTNIGMGGLIGGLFGTATSIMNRDYTQELIAREAAANMINIARNNWLKAGDIYTKDAQGNYILDAQKLASVTYNQFKAAHNASIADEMKDPNLRELYKKDAFASFVSSHIKNGTFDFLMRQLDTQRNYTAEDLVAMGFDPNQNSLNQMTEYQGYARRIKELRDTLDKTKTTDAANATRREVLYELGARNEALKDELGKVGGKLATLSGALENASLSDPLVEEINTLKAKRAIYEANKEHASDPEFYEKQIKKIDKDINTLEKGNEETLSNIKQDKEGFYSFENPDRNKSPFMAEYAETLTKNASLQAAREATLNDFDKVHNDGKYFQEMMDKQIKEAQEAAQAMVAAEAAKKAEQKKQEEAKQKAQKLQNEQATQTQTTQTPPPVPKEGAPTETEKPEPKKEKSPAPPKEVGKNIPSLTVPEIENRIPLTDYIDRETQVQLNSIIMKGYKDGKISEEEADRLVEAIQAKQVVGTQLSDQDEWIKYVALKLFRKEDLNPDQRIVYNLHKEEVEAELGRIRKLYNQVENLTEKEYEEELPWDKKEGEQTPEETTEEIPAKDTVATVTGSPTVENTPNPPTETVDGNYDYNSADIVEQEVDPTRSLLAFDSSLKTVTQEEDEVTGRVIPDPYLDFKQSFLRRLLRGDSLLMEEYAAMMIKDRAELPRDQRAQDHLNQGGQLGSALIITDADYNVLYFDKNYIGLRQDEYDQVTNKGDYKPIVYSFTKDYWMDNAESRAYLAEQRTGVDFNEMMDKYEKEDVFVKQARALNEKGYNVKVKLDFVVPGASRKGKTPAKSSEILSQTPYNLQIISGQHGRYVLTNNRLLVNGALYAVVEQDEEPSFHVRIIPNRIADVEDLYQDLKSLILHTYKSADEINTIHNYLNNILFLKERRAYQLLVQEVDNQFTFVFANKGEFGSAENTLIKLLDESRFNIDRTAIETGSFNTYFIKEGQVRSKTIDYHDFIINNSTTVDRPVLYNGKPSFRFLNTYMVFSGNQSNEDLFNILRQYEPKVQPRQDTPAEAKQEPLDEVKGTPQAENNNTTLTKDKVKRRKLVLGEPLSLEEDLKKLGEEMDASRDDILNMPVNADPIQNQEETELLPSAAELIADIERRRSEALQGVTSQEDIQRLNESYDQEYFDNGLDPGISPLQARVTKEKRPAITETEITKVNQMFGQDHLAKLSDIANSDSYGLWTTSGITLFKNAVEGTGYHEAWHHFSQLYLNKKEKRSLYDEVRTRAIDFKNRSGKSLNTRTTSDFEIEEFIADDFRDYVLSGGKSRLANRPVRNTIFRRILNFLRNFFFGRVDINKLYEELYSGNIKRYTPSVTNAMWGKLNAGIYNKEGTQIFDTAKASYYNGVLDALVGERLLAVNGSIVNMQQSPRYASLLYEDVRRNVLFPRYYEPLYTASENDQPYNEQLLDDLEILLENWGDVVMYHTRNTKLGYYIDEELPHPDTLTSSEADDDQGQEQVNEFTEEAVEANFAGKMFDRAGNESNSATSAPQEIRALIRMLPAVKIQDGNFVIQTDVNGFPKLNEYSRTWNNLAYELNGALTYTDMYNRLKNPEVQIRIPEATELLKRLPDPSANANTRTIEQITRFYTSFARDYIGIYSGTFDGNTQNFYFMEETRRNVDNIIRNWNNNFLQITDEHYLVKNGFVVYNEEFDKYALNPDNKLSFDFRKQADIDDMLELLGMRFSDASRNNPMMRRLLQQYLPAVQTNINDRHDNKQILFNPILDIKKGYNDVKSVNNIITSIARLESKFSSENPSMSFQTAEGEMIYALSLRNFLSTSVAALNSAKTYQDLINMPEFAHYDITNNPSVKHSLFLNSLFNLETGQRRTIKVDGKSEPVQLVLGNFNGLKLTGEFNSANSNTSLNTRQKMIFDMNALLSKGAIEIMRAESAASSFFIKSSNYNNGSHLPVNIENFVGGFSDPAFLNVMFNHLRIELERMKSFNGSVSETIKNSAATYHTFRDILSKSRGEANAEELKNKLKEAIKTQDVETVIDKNYNEIANAIVSFFKANETSFLRQMVAENINGQNIASSLLDKYNNNLAQLIRAFIGNSFILNMEFITMFDGDLSYQADYKDYFKRAKGDISTGRTPLIDSTFANYMKSKEGATFAGFLGSAHLNDYRTVRSATIEDYKTTSSYVDHGIMQKNLKAVNPNLSDEDIEKIVSKYREITVGDGQGHITLDFYRQFLISISNWSPQQEVAYQKELALFRMNYSNLVDNYSPEQRAKDEKFVEDNPGVISHFPPLKIQYNGPIAATGTFAKVLDKFSVAPLIPSIVKGTPFEQINIDLIKNGIGYTKFLSGTKKYKHPAAKMYQEDGSVGIDFSTYQPSTHFLTFLREQINTNPDIKEESSFGSQVRKLIMSNLFSQGKASEKNQKRFDRYVQIMKDMVSIEKDQLFKEIGLATAEGRTVVKDMQRFITSIQRQIELRDLNDNIKDYVQYDKDTKGLKNLLEASLNRGQIQDVIMGIVDTRLRKLKVNGDMLIQISGAGFESTNFKYKRQTEEEVRQNGTNDLKFYDLQYDENGKPVKTRAMEVKVALVGGFESLLNRLHPDGNRIETIGRLNELLRNQEWADKNADSIEIVGYRIPTQGTNSIEVMRVKEFLDPSAGSSIVLPAEIVIKAGSDYDIDKMFIFRPSFTENGSLIKEKQVGGKAEKARLTNEIIAAYKEVLQDPDMFERLITPNSTDIVKDTALDVAQAIGKKSAYEVKEDKKGKASPYRATQVLRYVNNLRKFDSLLSAKRLLGIFAVHNSFSQVLQQGGVKMNTTYAKNKKVKLFLHTPQERLQVLNEDKTKLDLSNVRDVTGVLKQEYFSQLINATVDIGSDDFIGFVNLSYENAGVLTLLIHQGIPFDRALWFVNHPVLVKYYSQLKAGAGAVSKKHVQASILTGLGEVGLFDSTTGKVKTKELERRIQAIINNKSLGEGYYYGINYLKKAANKTDYDTIMAGANEDKAYSLRLAEKTLFAYFLSLQEQAQGMMEFRSALNYDTTKFATPIDLVASFEKEKIMTSEKGLGLFDKESVDRVNKTSVISPFSNKKLMWQIVSNVMPVGYNAKFLAKAAQTVSTVFGRKNTARISKGMANDFIEFIVKNFGTTNGIPLRRMYQHMISGKGAMAKRLITLKNKYPELADNYNLVKRLKPNIDTKSKAQNIEVQRIFENTTSDQNRYIAEFRDLIHFSNPYYSREQQLEIQKFFKDLSLFAFLQSGFTRSNISFQELVPQEEMSIIFNTALRDFKDNVTKDPAILDEAIDEFLKKFKTYNKNIFNPWYSGKIATPWRGKDYTISPYAEKVQAVMPKYIEPKVEVPKLDITPKVEETTLINPIPVPQTADRTSEIRDLFRTNKDSIDFINKMRQDPKKTEDIISADMKEMAQNLKKMNYGYIKFTKDLTEDQRQDILEKIGADHKPTMDKYYAKLTMDNFSDMLKYYDEFGDDILDDDGHGEIDLDSIINMNTEVSVILNRGYEMGFTNSANLLYDYLAAQDNYEEEELEAMAKKLKELGLAKYTDIPIDIVDPNQMKLFTPEELDKLEIKPNCKE